MLTNESIACKGYDAPKELSKDNVVRKELESLFIETEKIKSLLQQIYSRLEFIMIPNATVDNIKGNVPQPPQSLIVQMIKDEGNLLSEIRYILSSIDKNLSI